MKDLEFIQDVVDYFNENQSTVRETAKHFGISKSSVHRYLTKVKPNGTSSKILATNRAERHLRGGEATKNRYLSMRSQ